MATGIATSYEKITAEYLQRKAIERADEYSRQLQVFLEQIKSSALDGTGYIRPSVSNGLDVGEIKEALDKLIAGTQLNPPAILALPNLEPLPIPTLGPTDATVNIPEMTPIQAPSVRNADAPYIETISFTGQSPIINYPVAPERPQMHIPTLAASPNIVMPVIADLVIPILTAIPPSDAITAPTGVFTFKEEAYSSTLLDNVKSKLSKDLTNGGYGIETKDEEGLWSRAADREMQGASIASADVMRTAVSRGFSVPPGAMVSQLASIQQGVVEKLSSVSRDIAMKRADMYVENRKFTITEAREVEQMTITIHMSAMERALNSSKAVAEFGISLYNARVAKYSASMEGFKAKVQAYGEQVRAVVAQNEAQRMKMDIVQAEISIDKNRVEVYKANMEAQKSLMDMYRTDVAVMQGLADAEKLKLEQFRSEVQLFSERLKVGTVQLQGYEAQMRGDMTRVEIYKTQVGAQTAQLEVAKIQASIVEANARMAAENLRAGIASVAAKADIYKSQAAGVASANESQSRAFASRTEAFKAISQVYDVMGRVQVSDADMTMRAATDNLRADIDQTKIFYDFRSNMLNSGASAIGEAIKAQLGQVLGIASAITTSAS